MSSRFIRWTLLAGVTVCAGVVAVQNGHFSAWGHWGREWMEASTGKGYSSTRFQQELVGGINAARSRVKIAPLRSDEDLERWLAKEFATLPLGDMDLVTKRVQETLPRYFRVSVCTASGPTVHALLEEFRDFSQRTQPEMTHVGCAVRKAAGGLAQQGLIVVGQRLQDFSPEILNTSEADAFFSACPLCRHPHVVRISRQQRSLGLECPQCRRTYAVVATDQANRFRYVNEFLTGYAPPAVFAKDQSRLKELFTLWSAVHSNCVYTKDPGAQKDQTDSWQTSLETQRLGRGDCEDSSIFLCDWLLTRGFQARVALGRYGDLGGHAWCVVRIGKDEYLLESTEGKPDPANPPLVARVGSRYIPEVMFDRFSLYVRTRPGQPWQGDYFSTQAWSRIEPRSGAPVLAANFLPSHDPASHARTSQPNPAAAPFMQLEGIPKGAEIWQMPLRPQFGQR